MTDTIANIECWECGNREFLIRDDGNPGCARCGHISSRPNPTAQHINSAIDDYEFKVYGQVNDGKEKTQLEEFIRKLTKGEK